MQDMGREIQETVQACEKLREKVTENKARLLQATQLQEFFRNYLAMISWTEDTRTCIFSESSGAAGADRKPPSTQRQELDEKIEGKFQEFEELKARGQRLLDEEHHLSETIKERIEELQSMLGWVLVRWRAQKHQRHHGNRKEKRQIQELPGDASIISPLGFQERAIKTSQPEEKALPTSKISGSSQVQLASTEAEVPKSQPPATLPAWDLHPSESNLQASLARTRGTKGGLPAEELELGSADELAAQEPAQTPLVVMQQPGVMPLGGMVNLILSFGKKGENKLQVQRANSGMEIESEETLHRLAESKSSGCKNFWKRCQGLLGNTFGSLKRKKKTPGQSAEEVSTFVHVKDKDQALKPTCEGFTLPYPSSKRKDKGSPSFESSISTFHTLPKLNSNSIFNSLKGRGKKKKKTVVQGNTIQKIMGIHQSTYGSSLEEKLKYNTNTWPLKHNKREPRIPSPVFGELVDYIRNPLVKDIDAECSMVRPESESDQSKTESLSFGVPGPTSADSNCRHLALGSVLSLDLPKDLSLLGSFSDLIKIGPLEKVKKGDASVESSTHLPNCSGHKQTEIPETDLNVVLSCSVKPEHSLVQKTQVHGEKLNRTPKCGEKVNGNGTCFQDTNLDPSNNNFKFHETSSVPDAGEHRGTKQDNPSSSDDFLGFKLKRLSRISILHEQIGHEWDRIAAKLNTSGSHARSKVYSHVNYMPSADEISKATVNSDVAVTQDKDKTESEKDSEQDRFDKNFDSSLCKNFNDSEQSLGEIFQDFSPNNNTDSSSQLYLFEQVVNNQEDNENREILGLSQRETKVVFPKATYTTAGDINSEGLEASVEVVHPDHDQFEEEEEELEDIWNKTNEYRQSICSDIMYTTYKKELAESSVEDKERNVIHSQDTSSRKLVMTSAPNLLVAEFKLPSSTYNLQNLEEEREESSRPIKQRQTCSHRKSWTAFSYKEQTNHQITLINETASDLVEVPCLEHQQNYIYQYGEEEEDSNNTKGEFASHFSLQTNEKDLSAGNAEDTNCKTSCCSDSETVGCRTLQCGDPPTTRGGYIHQNLSKTEFQSMEGTLERKHILQLGGKKACNRTWSAYHAVLFRQTLCFYQDRKDSLKSSVAALPLNLTGAACTQETDYTKKTNCFKLQLRDGSEYLLSAPSRVLMREWISKIQLNSDLGESDPFSLILQQPPRGTCSEMSRVSDPGSLHRSFATRLDGTSSRRSADPLLAAKAKEITVLTRPSTSLHWHHGNEGDLPGPTSLNGDHQEEESSSHGMRQKLCQWNPTAQQRLSDDLHHSDDPALVMNKRRSHSFTSATYQKILPTTLPSNPNSEPGSCYSVTVYIGDQSAAGQRSQSHSFVANQDSGLQGQPPLAAASQADRLLDRPEERSYGSLPKHRNKSVFRKFFGKKE
nr:PREDICTED: uncharacterized protein LOC106705856 [Latimeria chalumnae]|eukprot:XP_014351383.1 PREDICTED: uncharacterized protein LOC106705856 [Latimeria chalumnae]